MAVAVLQAAARPIVPPAVLEASPAAANRELANIVSLWLSIVMGVSEQRRATACRGSTLFGLCVICTVA